MEKLIKAQRVVITKRDHKLGVLTIELEMLTRHRRLTWQVSSYLWDKQLMIEEVKVG